MFRLFRNRSYRLLFSASAITNLGDGTSALAFPWLATLITRDPLLIGFVAFATRMPWLLLSIPAGVITDRSDRQRLMVAADTIRMLLTFGVIALILSVPALPPSGKETLYIVLLSGLAFLLGTAEVLRDNAAQTILPSIVDKDDLEDANGQMWSVEQVIGQFLGPPLAGLLIALAVPAPFLLDAVTFLLAALLVRAIRVPEREAHTRKRFLDEMSEGWRWMRENPMVLRVAVMLGVLNGMSIMGFTMLILLAQERLGLSAAAYGLLLTAGAAGGVVGGLAGPRIIALIGRKEAMLAALGINALAFIVIAFATGPIPVAAALFFEALGAMLWNIVTVSWRQRIIPDALLGRVNSIYRFFGWGVMPVGALLGGIIVAAAEPAFGRDTALQFPYLIGAGVMLLVLAYGARRVRL